MAEEDIYQYTEVTIVAPPKEKPPKDFIFCQILIIFLFVIVGEHLIVYSAKINPLNMVYSEYITPMHKESLRITEAYKASLKVFYNIKEVQIPVRPFKFPS
jgi:hypothetical protein